MEIFIQNLHEGIHELEEEIPAGQIELPERELYPNPLKLKIFIDKLENIFRFKIRISTKAHYTCDRCLDEFDQDFEIMIEQIYQLGHSELDEDEEIELLPEDTREIDISPAISEAFLINRPIKLLCNETCRGLCVDCGTNLNHEKCNCADKKIDPRFEKLKSLLK